MPVTRSRLATALLKLANLKGGMRKRRAPVRRRAGGQLGVSNITSIGAGRKRRVGRPRKRRATGSAPVGGSMQGGRRRVYRRRR